MHDISGRAKEICRTETIKRWSECSWTSSTPISREIFHSPDEAIVQFDVLKCRVKRDPSSPMGTYADQAFQFLLQYLEETCQRESGCLGLYNWISPHASRNKGQVF